uniref:WDR36/Utp21 C-terminal domain-containing protein n=1 Tax=Wuchereria bancrofti TaxID=6293 RepID=A0AAF5Q6P1_WUCBA
MPLTEKIDVLKNLEDEVQCSIEETELPTENAWENIQKVKQVESLVTLSGLAPSRWVNLPYLDVIRERNKPIELVRKPKTAHFSYRPYQHLMFEKMGIGADVIERRIVLMAKRSVLEIESPFAETLASDDAHFITAFESLKWMSISTIDFQIHILPERALNSFLKMLITVLRNHCDFELVQAYLTAFLKTSWNKLWISCIRDDDLDKTLSKLSDELKKS